ncbi:MAG: hypothetical protein J6J19_07170, partial [Oscillospiraceae bacterium]|nr:hypothetical protein [Oscillospiraceae bacterium]
SCALEAHISTLSEREVFSPTYTPPAKMIELIFCLRAKNSARLCLQSEPAGFFLPVCCDY